MEHGSSHFIVEMYTGMYVKELCVEELCMTMLCGRVACVCVTMLYVKELRVCV